MDSGAAGNEWPQASRDRASPCRSGRGSGCDGSRRIPFQQRGQTGGVGGRCTLLVIVEKDEYAALLTLPDLDMPCPFAQRGIGVVATVPAAGTVTPHIDVGCGGYPRRRRKMMV